MFEKLQSKNWHPYTTIDRQRCSDENRVGYCWSEIHRGYLTQKLLKEHQCIEKECKHFQKFEDAPYWKNKEKAKENKKREKENKKRTEEEKTIILNRIRKLTQDDEEFFAVSVEKEKQYYIVRYIKFGFINMSSYIQKFKEDMGKNFFLQEIKTSYVNKKAIVDKHKKQPK